MSASPSPLDTLARAAGRRLAWVEAQAALRRWAFRLGLPLAAALALDSAVPLPVSPRPVLWLLWLIGAAWVFTQALARRRDPAATLACVDRRLGLFDLLSTSYEESCSRPGAAFTGLLRRRADKVIPEVDLGGLAPSPWRRRPDGWFAVLYAAALLLTWTAPLGPRLWGGAAFLASSRAEAERLEAVGRRLAAAKMSSQAARVRRLAAVLGEGRLSRNQALRSLDALERSFAKPKTGRSRETAGELARAGAALAAEGTKDLARALRSGDLRACAEALERLADSAGSLAEEPRRAVASDLREASKSFAPSGRLGGMGRDLDEAAGHLGAGQSEGARRSLAAAAGEFRGLEREGSSGSALEEAAAQLAASRRCLGSSGLGSSPGAAARQGAEPRGPEAGQTEGGSGQESGQAGGQERGQTAGASGQESGQAGGQERGQTAGASGQESGQAGGQERGQTAGASGQESGQGAGAGQAPGQGTRVCAGGTPAEGAGQASGQAAGGAGMESGQGNAGGAGTQAGGGMAAAGGMAGAGGGGGAEGTAQQTSEAGQGGGSESAKGAAGRLSGFRRLQAPEGVRLNIPESPQGSEGGTVVPGRSGSVRGGGASTPLTSVLPRYRRAAEEAIGHERVPSAYRQMVRDYFQLLQPSPSREAQGRDAQGTR